jgi:hypothetical protein
VVPNNEICEKSGITIVQTSYQHNDMRDTGPDEAKYAIQATLDKFLDDDSASALAPVDTTKAPKIAEPSGAARNQPVVN